MKQIEQIHSGTWKKSDTFKPIFEAEEKDNITPILEEYAARLDAKIRDAMEQSNTGFFDVKEQYQQADFSEVANDIWEALNEIDDTPIAQIIHGAVYGVSEKAVEIGSAIYQVVSERFGETLTTTINDVDAYNRLIDPLIKEVQADLDAELFSGNSQTFNQDKTDEFTQKKIESDDVDRASNRPSNEPPSALESSNPALPPDTPLTPSQEALYELLQGVELKLESLDQKLEVWRESTAPVDYVSGHLSSNEVGQDAGKSNPTPSTDQSLEWEE